MNMEEIEFHEEYADRTLHGLGTHQGIGYLAYYNYKGTHFRVFNSFEDGLSWLDNGDDNLIIAEFDTESELDDYLELHKLCKSS